MSSSPSSSQNATANLAAGAMFGRYKIEKKLGEGAMGAVFLALDSKLSDRPVALKVPKFSGEDREMELQRFHREAGIAATMSHPNLCPIYDVGELDGTHYIAMGFIEGKPLNEMVGGKSIAEKQAALLVRKIALAMQAAHDKGVVHRDLKPANIMMDARREPIVMDFGLAKQKGGINDAHITQSGMILGTPAYMSPEQVNGELDLLGPPADVYSLGVILYELLTGVRPFQGPITAVLGQIIAKEPPPPSRHRPNLDPRLEAIVLKAMAKKLEDRYPSMTVFAAALGDFVKQLNTGSSVAISKDDEVIKTEEISVGSVGALVDAARQCLQAYDYAEASRLFETIPPKFRTDEIETLWTQAAKRAREVDDLQTEIELATEARKYKSLQPKLERLLKLKPGHAEAKKLLKRLNTYGDKTAKFRYSESGELLPAAKADSLFEGMGLKYAAVAGVAFVAFCIGSGMIYSYLRKPKPEQTASTNETPGSQSSGSQQSTRNSQPVTPIDDQFALEFDGKSSYVDVPSLKLLPSAGPFTAEAWAQAGNTTDFAAVLGTVGPNDEFHLQRHGLSWVSSVVQPQSTSVELDEQKTTGLVHLAAVWDGKRHQLFVNGRPAKPFPSGVVLTDNTGTAPRFLIGADLVQNVMKNWFPGTIDEVRISKVARYDKAFTPKLRFDTDADTLALYHFDEGQGEVLKDSSGNNHHGKIIGAKWVKVDGAAIIAGSTANFTNSLGMEFVRVPKGRSWLGGGGGKPGTQEVTIPADFYLGKYEVTQDEWFKVMGNNPSSFQRTGSGKELVQDFTETQLRQFPVDNVTWTECQDFLKRLNEKVPDSDWVYRLPTVAEWEYACRGGPMTEPAESAFDFYFEQPTNTLLPEWANCSVDHTKLLKRTCQVGSYRPNRLGFFDMHGNVWERCDDRVTNEKGESLRPVKGGGWINFQDFCRAAHQSIYPPSNRHDVSCFGLRVARVPVGNSFGNSVDEDHLDTEEAMAESEAIPAGQPAPSVILNSPDWVWSEAKSVGSEVNTAARESSPSLSGNERALYFVRDGVAMVCKRKSIADEFQNPRPLVGPLNQLKDQDVQALSITSDGLLMALSLRLTTGRRTNQTADEAVYLCERRGPRVSFGKPVRLPNTVNAAKVVRWPWISRNGLALIVAHPGKDSLGKADLYLHSRESRDEEFGPAVHFNNVVNTKELDFGGAMSSDRLVLFRSTRFAEPGKISQVVTLLCTRPAADANFVSAYAINASWSWMMPAAIVCSNDGKRIYFQSAKNGDDNHLDLYMAERVPKGTAGK